ncbi:splicing factor C9orf78 homolog [Corticium candelabrum]|uniref:splicing factor C9orf78 homolog n=1 Tax=Corticium candelabrum TaxID=121492 RepID=UPI002E26FB98|nr:splicing factor C9orf78 homolog [Corticium candelabrum]
MKRTYRKRKLSDDADEDAVEGVSKVLEETRELQKFRERSKGVSAAGLAFGKKIDREQETETDPFKITTGGLIDMKNIRDSKKGDEEEVSLEGTFASETHQRDEDTRMMQYIDEEMAKRKGIKQDSGEPQSAFEARKAALYTLPENLKVESSKRSDEMLSNQMLSGIPEVDLGIESKFRNIEETEIAKRKVFEESRSKKTDGTTMLPTNMAADFVHHNRFFQDKPGNIGSARKAEQSKSDASRPKLTVGSLDERNPLAPTVKDDAVLKISLTAGPQKPTRSERASDDYHFEKFKRKAIKKY